MAVKHGEFTFPPEFGFTGSAGKSHVSAHERAKPMKHGGKSMKPGGGGRFAKLKGELSHEKGIKNPGALAAAIGRKKYGAHKMAHFAAEGRARHHMKEGGQVDKGEYAETEKDDVEPGKADQYKHGGHVRPGGKHHYKHGGHVKQAEHEAEGGHVKDGGRHQFAKGGLNKGPEKREHEGEFEDFKHGGKAKHHMSRGGKC